MSSSTSIGNKSIGWESESDSTFNMDNDLIG